MTKIELSARSTTSCLERASRRRPSAPPRPRRHRAGTRRRKRSGQHIRAAPGDAAGRLPRGGGPPPSSRAAPASQLDAQRAVEQQVGVRPHAGIGSAHARPSMSAPRMRAWGRRTAAVVLAAGAATLLAGASRAGTVNLLPDRVLPPVVATSSRPSPCRARTARASRGRSRVVGAAPAHAGGVRRRRRRAAGHDHLGARRELPRAVERNTYAARPDTRSQSLADEPAEFLLAEARAGKRVLKPALAGRLASCAVPFMSGERLRGPARRHADGLARPADAAPLRVREVRGSARSTTNYTYTRVAAPLPTSAFAAPRVRLRHERVNYGFRRTAPAHVRAAVRPAAVDGSAAFRSGRLRLGPAVESHGRGGQHRAAPEAVRGRVPARLERIDVTQRLAGGMAGPATRSAPSAFSCSASGRANGAAAWTERAPTRRPTCTARRTAPAHRQRPLPEGDAGPNRPVAEAARARGGRQPVRRQSRRRCARPRAHPGAPVRARQRLGRRAASAADENAYLESHSWEDYASWHLGLTEGAADGTKARYAFVCGDFRRIHRTGLIACVYRASEEPQGGRARGARPAPAARPNERLTSDDFSEARTSNLVTAETRPPKRREGAALARSPTYSSRSATTPRRQAGVLRLAFGWEFENYPGPSSTT